MNDEETNMIAGQTLMEALLDLNRQAAREALIAARQPPERGELFENTVTAALGRIGSRWDAGELALSQVYMSGRICEELIEELLPERGAGTGCQPLVAIGTLADQHVLGKRIVLSALRAGGISVRDYGGGLSVQEMVDRSRADGIRVLLVSVLMLRSALKVKDLVDALRGADLPVQVVAGGAPFQFDPQLRYEVGAAITGNSASDAVTIVRRLLGGHQ